VIYLKPFEEATVKNRSRYGFSTCLLVAGNGGTISNPAARYERVEIPRNLYGSVGG
jgi:hypothetical protein